MFNGDDSESMFVFRSSGRGLHTKPTAQCLWWIVFLGETKYVGISRRRNGQEASSEVPAGSKEAALPWGGNTGTVPGFSHIWRVYLRMNARRGTCTVPDCPQAVIVRQVCAMEGGLLLAALDRRRERDSLSNLHTQWLRHPHDDALQVRLVVDSCRIHGMGSIKSRAEAPGNHLMFIPFGATDELQPLDPTVFGNMKIARRRVLLKYIADIR